MQSGYAGYLVFCIGVLESRADRPFRRLNDAFKGVDSDFDLERAIENFNMDEYMNMTQKMLHSDLGPKPSQKSNITSEEITKLLKDGEALIDTSGERERTDMKRLIERDMQENKIKKNTTNKDVPQGRKRVKRQGKFEEAAKVDNLKMLRIYLTMIKNLYSVHQTGGTHPLHTDVPKSVCMLFKHRIMQFFFPPVGAEKIKD